MHKPVKDMVDWTLHAGYAQACGQGLAAGDSNGQACRCAQVVCAGTTYTRRTPVHDRLIWDGAELLRRSITNHVGPHLRQLILQCIALPTYRF